MIRIVKSKTRNKEDYLLIAQILEYGLAHYCSEVDSVHPDSKVLCHGCPIKHICPSVLSAIDYAEKLAMPEDY